MRCCVLLLLGWSLAVLTSSAAEIRPDWWSRSEISSHRVRQIAASLPEKPRGFGSPISDRDFWESPAIRQRCADALKSAVQRLGKPYPAWSDDDYLDFSRTGRRTVGETMLRARNGWMEPLVLAECLENQGRFLPAILDVLKSETKVPCWTLPAHDRSLENFHRRHPSVDLRSAEMAADLAQALYLLADRIPTQLRGEVIRELEFRVFSPVRDSLKGGRRHWWMGSKHDPVQNNWNAVCWYGVSSAARTVLEDRLDRAVIIAAAEHHSQYFIRGFTDDGYCDEGPGYWGYGFGCFVAMREVLSDATHGTVELFTSPKIPLIASYGKGIQFPAGDVPPFSDCRANTRISSSLLAYLDRVLFSRQPDPSRPTAPPYRGLAASLMTETLAPDFPPASSSMNAERSFFGQAGVLVCRPAKVSVGTSDALAFAIKAGGNRSHSHNDIGSFVLSLDGWQPLGDPGGPYAYDADTFGPKRYEKKLLNSYGHPVPLLDGTLQSDATRLHPKVIESRFSDAEDRIRIDLTCAYPLNHLKSLIRTATYQRGAVSAVTIEDHVVFEQPGRYELALPTRSQIRVESDGQIIFTDGKRSLIAEVVTPDGFDTAKTTIDELHAPPFTRLAIRLKQPLREGNIRIRFQPMPIPSHR